jgi:hypothetical protein
MANEDRDLEKSTAGLSIAEIRQLALDAEQAAQEEPETVIFQRTVAGKIFSASSMEELTDQLAAASEEALQFAAKPAPAKELTALELQDREFVRAQSLASTPTKEFRTMLAEELGVQSIDDVKSRFAKLTEYENNQCAEQFVASTPDFFPCKENGDRMTKAMQAANIPISRENLQKTYESLRDKNLLKVRPPEVDPWSLDLETLKALANNAPVVDSDTDF